MIQVVKRNGVSVDFHPDKIQIAISKANKEVDKDQQLIKKLLILLVKLLRRFLVNMKILLL